MVRDYDRFGNERWYLRVPNCPKYRFKAKPFDQNGQLQTAFITEYDRALEQIIHDSAFSKAVEEDVTSLNFLLKRYFMSPEFKSTAAVTQRDKRSVLERYVAEHGHRPFAGFTKKHLELSVAKRSGTPGAADKLIRYLKTVFNWSISEGLADKNPASGVKKINKTDGHHAWSEEEITRFRNVHGIGTTARLALELTLNSGARRDDLIKLGPRNLVNGRLAFTPGKVTRSENKPQITIPMLRTTTTALTAKGHKGLSFLANEYGRSFTGNGFGNRMRKWADEAGLPDCSTHGLRKSAAIRMAYAGATAPELMAVFGWRDMKTALYYIVQAEQDRLSDNAFAKLMAAEGL